MAQYVQKPYPEAFPQQNPHYGYDQGPPPAYNLAPSAPNTQVIVNQPAPATTNTVFVTTQIKPPNYLGLSIFVLLCCNLPLGIIALIFSILSDNDYGAGDVEGARSKGKVAMGLGIAGMVSTIIVVVVVLVYYFAVVAAAVHAAENETSL